MEPTSGTHSDTRKETFKSHTWRKGTDMDYTLALVMALLQLSACMAAPVTQDSVNIERMKTTVMWMAQQLVVRMDRTFPGHNGLPPNVNELEGSASVVTSLEGYNNLISDSFGGVLQIKAEISSLAGYLDHWRQGNCHEQRPNVLQTRKIFSHTVSLQALMRVKEFLKLLLKNPDHLEKC